MPDVDDADSQDLAEVFDEDNTTEDGFDIAVPDMARDEYDVTAADDDDLDDDLAGADADDFDPDEVDEEELEVMLEEDDGIDADDDKPADDTDRIPADRYAEDRGDYGAEGLDDDEDDESGESSALDPPAGAARGPAAKAGERKPFAQKTQDERLDEVVEDSFPASDPYTISHVD